MEMCIRDRYGTGKREENLRGYFAAISAMDEQIGRLLDAVEEQGLADNCLLYTSGKFELATAVGLFKSVINFALVVIANKTARMAGEEGIY